MSNISSDKSEDNYTNVQVTTIDQYCQDNNIEKIDVVKIDVEGVEAQVLKGAVESFRKYKPALLIESVNQDLVENRGIIEIFKQHDLQVQYRTASDPTFYNIDQLPNFAKSQIEKNKLHDNYVFKFL